MKTAIVNFSDVGDTEKNPTLCLSALRYTGSCYRCLGFKSVLKRTGGNLEEAVKKVKCNPIITEEAVAAHKELRRLQGERGLLQAKIAAIEKKINEGITPFLFFGANPGRAR